MSALILRADCACTACAKGHKVTSQRGAAEHLGIDVRDFRAAVRQGNGPPQFNPTTRSHPRYVITRLDEWAHGRDDGARSAA